LTPVIPPANVPPVILRSSGSNASIRVETPETRSARLKNVVQGCLAVGETLPQGIDLIDTRSPTEEEIAFALSLDTTVD